MLKIETDYEMAYWYAARLDVAWEGGKAPGWRYDTTVFSLSAVIKECCPDYGLATNSFVAKLTAAVRRDRRHAGPCISVSGAHVE